jgi:hypothetical protein
MKDLGAAAASVSDTAGAAPGAVSTDDLLAALVLLRQVQAELAAAEPALIAAARAAGVSWQDLAPALGVASRQAAERRYLRATATGQRGDTRDDRVQAERDRRAEHRAAARWATDHTADLRRLAARITALTGLGPDATGPLQRLHDALTGPDTTALPGLLADTHRHLGDHPELAAQVDDVRTGIDEARRQTRDRR